MIKRITHKPRIIDRSTATELSWYFRLAIIPMMKAMMLAGKIMATVKSHQRSSKLRTRKTFTNKIETTTAVTKKRCNPNDHLPNVVFGIIISIINLMIALFDGKFFQFKTGGKPELKD